MDEGFMRNIRTVFGPGGTYAGIDKPIKNVEVSEDKDILTINFEDGSRARWKAEGDCCSHSWIEHLTVPNDIQGTVMTDVSDELISRVENEDEYETLQSYQTKFRTPKGDIIVEYRNSSNGYYGGMLTRIDESGNTIY